MQGQRHYKGFVLSPRSKFVNLLQNFFKRVQIKFKSSAKLARCGEFLQDLCSVHGARVSQAGSAFSLTALFTVHRSPSTVGTAAPKQPSLVPKLPVLASAEFCPMLGSLL